jgi:hypothetical protein
MLKMRRPVFPPLHPTRVNRGCPRIEATHPSPYIGAFSIAFRLNYTSYSLARFAAGNRPSEAPLKFHRADGYSRFRGVFQTRVRPPSTVIVWPVV